MELAYGIIIGAQFVVCLGLGAAIYYLHRQQINQAKQIAANESDIAKNADMLVSAGKNISSSFQDIGEKFSRITDRTETFDSRIKILEAVEVPEHLTLTQEQTVRKEVRDRLAKSRSFTDINYLDNVRDEELAAYNAE